MKSVIVGTAGHIDHGKTALVKALTGIDADRLQEEKRRGITIDIGFAHLELPGENGEIFRLGFVDVPGHERFVRNMLAGIGGIDFVLLVISAEEGIKPQTIEHFDICRLLSIPRGITVITKSDLVDTDTLDIVKLEVESFLRGSFLEGAPILAVSSKTGAGLDQLKRELVKAASEVQAKNATANLRLPIDRVFTMKGFGTVITGTMISGTVAADDGLELFPGGKSVRVRGVQVHGTKAPKAHAGERTALNLSGVSTEDVARGMTLAQPGLLKPTRAIDVSLNLLKTAKPLKDRARVHFHAYTSEMLAEVVLYEAKQLAPGKSAFAQLRLAESILLLPGDRFILRQFSPVITIGGGTVLDAVPLPRSRARKKEEIVSTLAALQSPKPEAILHTRVSRRGIQGLTLRDALAETGWHPSQVATALLKSTNADKLLKAADTLITRDAFEKGSAALIAELNAFHGKNPLVAGISKGELREKLDYPAQVFTFLLDELTRQKKIELTGETIRLAGRGVVLKDEEAESKRTIENAFASAGLKVPALKEVLAGLPVDKVRAQKIVTLLLRDRILVKLADELVFHQSALNALRQQLAAEKAKSPKIDIARFKDLTGITRKYAIPLLEYLDRERVTKRVGDDRIIL